MSKKQVKLLVETSVVRAKVGPSTPAHEAAFDRLTSNTSMFTSVYIRMEFIRRWICAMIGLADAVSRFDSVSDAISYLEQSFSIRDVKAYMACLAEHLKSCGSIDNSSMAADELARTAFHWLRRFDALFPSRIQNRSHCKRGGKVLKVESFETLLEHLCDFMIAFSTPVTECEVNEFLKLTNTNSGVGKLLSNVTDKQVDCLVHLREYAAKQTVISCNECERIGDAVIALEQTRQYTLAHVDGSFNHLCDALGMPHLQLPSLRAAQKVQQPPP